MAGPPEEVDHQAVGAAISTISSNLPEMAKGVRLISALMQDEHDDRLRPGMSATVMFTLVRIDDTLAVSLSGVFSTAEAMRYVFLKKGERFEVHPVETGIADTRRVQILSGLQIGEEVALMRPLEYDGEIPVPTAQPSGPTKKADSAAPTNAPSGTTAAPEKGTAEKKSGS